MNLLNLRTLGVRYAPQPDERPFLQRLVCAKDADFTVSTAVLDDQESERFFGVPLARRGMQPVWLQIVNHGGAPYRLRLASLDPNYYPPLEAAFLNHFAIGKRIAGFGLLAWLLFLPLLLLLPLKLVAVRSANRRMNAFFQQQAIGWGIIRPGQELSGFVFASHDEGTKMFTVKLQGVDGVRDFAFSVPVPGLRVDHGGKRLEDLTSATEEIVATEDELRQRIAALPRCTSNQAETKDGDPLNLVVIGDFDTILTGFGARWDETETINLRSCWRMVRAFLLSSRYRYSPVSPLYVNGRSQDFALQKARQTINQRLHLRLWRTPLRYQGEPVWIGQVSRDIGVRLTLQTWNLTTHKIDPDVDDARDYVLDDLMESGHVRQVGYGTGVGAAAKDAPRCNLTGDPYYTDGFRAVAFFSGMRTEPTVLNWT